MSFKELGYICSMIVPVFHIPLIMKLVRKKSSQEWSLLSVIGFWIATLGIQPWALMTDDRALTILNTLSLMFISVELVLVIKYRRNVPPKLPQGESMPVSLKDERAELNPVDRL